MRPLDLGGLVVVALLAVWVATGEGRRGPVLALLAAMVLAVAVGRVLARRAPQPFGLVTVGVAGAVVVTWPGLLEVTGAPTGYANANATFVGVGAIAAVGAAREARSDPARGRWLAVAVALLVAVPGTGSVAGTVVVLVGGALVLVGLATRWPPAAVVGGLVLCSLALGVTVAVGAGGDVLGLQDRAGVRADLWAGAEELADAEPLRGIGAGAFAERSPVTDDDDLRWAHHGALQVTAELGVVGLVLSLVLAGWMWVSLLRAAASDPVRPTVAAGPLAVVALHSTVDYVLHSPAVVIVMLVTLGIGTAGGTGRRGERPPAAIGWARRSSTQTDAQRGLRRRPRRSVRAGMGAA